MDNEKAGFRPLLTRAPFVEELLASPTEYDAAPAYVAQSVTSHSEEIKRAIADRTAESLAGVVREETLGQKARIAIELAAPVGFGVVRVTALASQLGTAVLYANPVTAVLSVPALFLTGRKALDDLWRALVIDPKVREHIQRAHEYTQAKQYVRAEGLILHALESDIDPAYRRNGDLYLQLGLIQFQDRRPRQAMVAFAKASVLFGEGDAIQFDRDGRKFKVSKRGWTEMLACAAIDSFAHDEAGLGEWSALVGDFARSAEKRFEHHAELRETGSLLGLFGVDPESAAECRALAAKVRFLRAKMQLRTAGEAAGAEADELIETALRELQAAGDLTPQERSEAILEQAQFYAACASRNESRRPEQARRALRLMAAAAEELDSVDPTMTARLRAEAAAFALESIPSVVVAGGDPAHLRGHAERLLDQVAKAATGAASSLDLAPVVAGWAEDQRYRLSATADTRAEATRRAHRAYVAAGEPVSSMYSALRLAYATEGTDGVREAIGLVLDAARRVLDGDADEVSRAFAAKYLLDASELVGLDAGGMSRRKSAEMFQSAARTVQRERRVVAFHLRGRLVVHGDAAAHLVLLGQSALEFARAKRTDEAVALLEEVSAYAGAETNASVRTAIELDRGAMLLALGEKESAEAILRPLERNAREQNDIASHRRALELLDRLRSAPASAGEEGPETDGLHSLVDAEPQDDDGFLGEFAAKRELVLREGRALLAMVESTGLDRLLRTGEHSILERIRGRLRRLEEGRLRIGIVGEFSAGKSTFLNALMGEAILPSSVRPTTCSIGHLRWGATPAVVVRYVDGRPDEQRPLAELDQFVTEKGNPKNQRGVREVEIEYPLPLLRQGVELVDTPGVSSLIAAHTETTYGLLPTCDAVVFLATGRQPYSESSGQFLTDVRSHVDGKLFYVVNKIDQLEPSRRTESLSFLAGWLGDRVDGARVFPMASYHALVARRLRAGSLTQAELLDDPRLGDVHDADQLLAGSGIEALERELGTFLTEQRGLPLVREVAGELLRIVIEIDRGLVTELQSSKLTAEKRREVWLALSKKLATAKAAVRKSHQGLLHALQRIVDEVQQQVTREVPTLTDGVMARIQIEPQDAAGDDATQKRLDKRIRDAIQAEMAAWLTRLSSGVGAKMQREVDAARRELRAHHRELNAEFGQTLQREMESSQLAEMVDAMALTELSDGQNVMHGIIGGVIGAVVVFAFGLIGLGALLLISVFTSDSPEEKKTKVDAKVREIVQGQLDRLVEPISERLRGRLVESTDKLVAAVRGEEDEAMLGFERELAALLRERDEGSAVEREAEKELRRVRQRTGEVERRLGVVLQGGAK